MRLRLGVIAALIFGVGPAAANAAVFSFDSSGEVVLSPIAGSGVWYPDRYPPAIFASGQNGGGRTGVLLENISADDSAANRPAAFSSPFYNTQGRKYDTAGASALFIDLYVPQAWDNLTQAGGRLASFWATGFDPANTVTNFYPIIEFNNDRPLGAGDGFRVWDSNSGWFNVGGFGGYDQWYRLGFILNGGQEQFFVDGNFVGSVSDPATTQFGNVILQGYNSGNSYNISWDNLSITSNLQDDLPAIANPEPTMLAVFGVPLLGLSWFAARRNRGAAARCTDARCA